MRQLLWHFEAGVVTALFSSEALVPRTLFFKNLANPSDAEWYLGCGCDGVVGVLCGMRLRCRHRLESPRSAAGRSFGEQDGAHQQRMGKRMSNTEL